MPERSRNSIRPAEDCAWQSSPVINDWQPARRATDMASLARECGRRLNQALELRRRARQLAARTYAAKRRRARGGPARRGTAWSRMLCALHHRARSGCRAQCNVVRLAGPHRGRVMTAPPQLRNGLRPPKLVAPATPAPATIAVAITAGPYSLPTPRSRLPTPAGGAIAQGDAERYSPEGKAPLGERRRDCGRRSGARSQSAVQRQGETRSGQDQRTRCGHPHRENHLQTLRGNRPRENLRHQNHERQLCW